MNRTSFLFKTKLKFPLAQSCHRPACFANLFQKLKMADKGWKAFQAEMKRKRTGTRAGKGKDDKNCKEELTVQRLSSEVAGKQQKYSRIGPREFVDFSGRELTIANIKEACTRHFASKIGVGIVCDILAGEQGPSCSTVKQIPDTKLIHVRFIDETEVEIEGRSGDTQDKTGQRCIGS